MLKKHSFKELSQIDQYSFIIAIITLLSALVIYAINALFFHYQGGKYLPYENILLSYACLLLMNIGFNLSLKKDHTITLFIRRFNIIYIVTAVIVVYTSTIQLTPFPIIDEQLVIADKWLNVDMPAILSFVHQHPYLNTGLTWAYQLLTPELFATLLLAAIFADKRSQSELVFLLLSSAYIGFTFYYFFPSTAPATLINSPYFLAEQHQTHIKFDLIHDGLPSPYSLEGGLIAMPSYHCIWILICQYYLMRWKWLGYALLPFNTWLIISCLCLGWHYLVDIIVSFIIVLSLIFLTKKITI